MKSLCMALYFGMLVGCANQTSFNRSDIREVYLPTNEDPKFERVSGLREAIATADGEPIRLIYIHGMITGERGYSRTSQLKIAQALGYNTPKKAEDIPLAKIELPRSYDVSIYDGPNWTGDVKLERSIMHRTVWPQTGDPELVVYELLWAPFRDEVKGRYFACFESSSFRKDNEECELPLNAEPNTSRTTLINKGVKEGIMVKGISDAMIVTGALGEVLKHDLRLAFCAIALEELSEGDFTALDEAHQIAADLNVPSCGYYLFDSVTVTGPDGQSNTTVFDYDQIFEDRPVFFITESLGSYFLFRSIWDEGQRDRVRSSTDIEEEEELSMDDGLRDFTAQLISNSTVFMFANQVSLLHLSALQPVCIPNTIEIPYTGFVEGEKLGVLEPRPRIETFDIPCPNSEIETLDSVKARKGTNPARTTYVAFNDRDDLLGYELAPYLIESGLASRLINVSVKNPAWGLPPLFRWFGSVHTNQEYNSAIIDAIVNGLELR